MPRRTRAGNSAESVKFRIAIANNLRRAINAKNWSIRAFARMAEVTESRMRDVVEANGDMRAIELAHWARLLGTTTDELVKGGVE